MLRCTRPSSSLGGLSFFCLYSIVYFHMYSTYTGREETHTLQPRRPTSSLQGQKTRIHAKRADSCHSKFTYVSVGELHASAASLLPTLCLPTPMCIIVHPTLKQPSIFISPAKYAHYRYNLHLPQTPLCRLLFLTQAFILQARQHKRPTTQHAVIQNRPPNIILKAH